MIKDDWEVFKKAKYKFWKSESGLFGGIIFGFLMPLIIILICFLTVW